MGTNIDIDDATLEAAMRAGPYETKKEAGLKLPTLRDRRSTCRPGISGAAKCESS